MVTSSRTKRKYPPTRPLPRRYRAYLKMALKYPETEASTSYGTPSVKIAGKILSRLRTEAEGALALHCDFVDRQILLQADPEAFFITDHYRNYPMILVRLEKIRAAALSELVGRAWRMRATPKMIAQLKLSKRR